MMSDQCTASSSSSSSRSELIRIAVAKRYDDDDEYYESIADSLLRLTGAETRLQSIGSK